MSDTNKNDQNGHIKVIVSLFIAYRVKQEHIIP